MVAGKKTILAIEDNDLNMKLIKALLQVDSIELWEAKDAETGLEMLKGGKPDLILMDIQLPGMDGYSAIRAIKNDPGLKGIPIVVLTALAMVEDKKRAIEAGCDGYIAKPLQTRPFLDTIRGFLGGQRNGQKGSREAPENYKNKLLIADQDPDNQRLYREVLGTEKYIILTASDGKEALEKAMGELPDLIILEIALADLDGFEVAKRIKAEPVLRNAPIILVTAMTGVESRATGLEAGAEEFLLKPVNPVELQARVKSMLRLKQYRDQLTIRSQSEQIFAHEAGEQGLSPASDLDKPLILLVEDNTIDAQIILHALQEEPIQVQAVKNGEAAISRVLTDKVDLILLDLLLPDMNGFEIFKRIKEIPGGKDIPIIIITCLSDMETKLKGVELGSDDFLIKPIVRRELQARMRILLEKKKQLDQLRLHYESALSSATIDWLSGLYNHGYFKKFFELELKRSQRHGYPVSLIMCDVDDFKKYNDQFGHAVGDLILREVGQVIKGAIREIDVAARYGGDEFAIVLAYADREGAARVAERIQLAMRAHDLLQETSLKLDKLTVSMGIAVSPEDGLSPEEIAHTADEMLYRAKQNGKNRFCFSERELTV